jgi:hypothetical protein
MDCDKKTDEVKNDTSKLLTYDLPPEHLQKIGDIIMKWSLIDFHIGRIIIAGFNIPFQTGRALTVGKMIKEKLNTLGILTKSEFWIKDNKIKDEIIKFSKTVNEYVCKRNCFAHGIFAIDLENSETYHIFSLKTSLGKPAIDTEELTLDGLQAIITMSSCLILQACSIVAKLEALQEKYL